MDSLDSTQDLDLEQALADITDLGGTYQLETDTAFLESKYQQLLRERDELRQRYERERREKESLEVKLHQEFDQRLNFEEKMSELSRNLSGYEVELQSLRMENGHLKTQFGQLRSAIQTRMSSSTITVQSGVVGSSFIGDGGSGFSASSRGDAPVPLNTEMYKQEVALLAQENELFKQIIDIIDKQEHGKVILEERASGQSSGRQGWHDSEVVMRLEMEKSRLEERIRDFERSMRDQERLVEEMHYKAEEDMRIFKRESKLLENELQSKTSIVEEYEIQLGQLKLTYEEEIHQLEIKLDMELTSKQEQTHHLEASIRKMEEERKEMVLKIEEVYKTENDVIEERSALEESYSQDVNELRRKIEEEIQRNAALSMEIERMVGELMESEKQKKEMEARFFHEAQEMKLQFEKEKDQIITYFNSASVNQVLMQSTAAQQAFPGVQQVSSFPQTRQNEGDWNRRLDDEVRKREKLEDENKKLLYQINDILEHNGGGSGMNNERSHKYENSETTRSVDTRKTNDRESEIDELRERCQGLERDARKKKELENKNMELLEEIEDLTSRKDEMVRKQKELVKELDNSLSSIQQVEDKNRRLMEDVDNLSRKIRQMEDSFRNEKDDWVKSYSKDKTSQINDILNEKEMIEKKYKEQVKDNKKLELEITTLESRVSELERGKERVDREKNEMTSHFTEEIVFERNRNKALKDELERSAEVFQRKTEQLETSSFERKKKYDEEIKTLEDEKQRFRKELENEKETYRSRFEEERKLMERRINEIEDRLRQKNVGNEGSVTQSTSSPQTALSQSDNTVSDLQRKIESLTTEKRELEEKFHDLERKNSRKMDDLKYENEQDKRKLIVEKENETRQKLEEIKREHETHIDELKRSSGRDRKGSEDHGRSSVDGSCSRGSGSVDIDEKLQTSINSLLKEQKEHMDELRRQIKLQKEAFESEKRNLRSELQGDRQSKENEKKAFHSTIHKLTEELKKLKHDKETLLNAIRKERGSSTSRITELSNTLSSVRDECETRVRKEREDSQKTTNELKRKLSYTENRIKEIEEKHRKDVHQIEVRFESSKTELQQNTTLVESQLRESLEVEYRAALNKQREKYEETLHVLRKEIHSLQEQRKQIQVKLSGGQAAPSLYKILLEKGVTANKEGFFKSEGEIDSRVSSRGTKQMEDRIHDLEREIQVLKQEKVDIKASYKQDKMQLQTEFDRERDGLEEKYRLQIVDLKRKLQTTSAQLNSMMISKKEDRHVFTSRHSTEAIGLVHDNNVVLETKKIGLEGQMGLLKDRLDDLEDRQKRTMLSRNLNKKNVRFSSSLDRSRDQSQSRLFSAMDLQSSVQQRGGSVERSRMSVGSHGTPRGREARSFINQSQMGMDSRPLMQSSWTRDDQNLSSGGYSMGNMSSASYGRQGMSSFRAPPSSFFHGRSLSGFDASRNSGFMQTSRSSIRNDQAFLPSVGILGGASLSRAGGGSLGSSMTGGYGSYMHGSGMSGLHGSGMSGLHGSGMSGLHGSGMSGLHGSGMSGLHGSGMSGLHGSSMSGLLSGMGVQHVRSGATMFDPRLFSGYDSRMYQSGSLSGLSHQFQASPLMPSSFQMATDYSTASSAVNQASQIATASSTEGSNVESKSQQTEDSQAGDSTLDVSTPNQGCFMGSNPQKEEEIQIEGTVVDTANVSSTSPVVEDHSGCTSCGAKKDSTPEAEAATTDLPPEDQEEQKTEE